MRHRRLQAPKQDGGVLVDPPFHEFGPLAEANRDMLESTEGTCLGRSWLELRHLARRSLLLDAADYSGESDSTESALILMSGHQPELFHPGVWIKNFALQGQARRLGATPVNLIVDSDMVKSTSLLVPDPSLLDSDYPRPLRVSFDTPTTGLPWEEQHVADFDRFQAFDREVADRIRPWGFEPLLSSLWPGVVESAREGNALGEGFARARRRLEREWGCTNLELPIHRVCQSESFAWFACSLLAETERFRATYNEIVREYRREHRIRSASHPVPELSEAQGWIETPLWGWTSAQPQRLPIFVRNERDTLTLRVGQGETFGLPHPGRHSAERTLLAWKELLAKGYKMRPRALITTLYARLFLCDLFLHGIGGGKYDELTNQLIERFFRRRAPRFAVLSGTCLLPFPHEVTDVEQQRRLVRRLRDLRWNPQNFIGEDKVGQTLAEEKRRWIRRSVSSNREREERFRRLQNLTIDLRERVHTQRDDIRKQLADTEHRLAVQAVLQRRDYSFALYPLDVLRRFCERFLGT